MKRFVRIIILTALILAGVLAGYQGIRNSSVSMDSLLGIAAAGDGSTVTGWYDNGGSAGGIIRVITAVEK